MNKVILFGTGQFAEVASYYLNNFSDFKIEAFTVHEQYIKEESFLEKPVVPYEKINNFYPSSRFKLFAPFNYKRINKARESIYNHGLLMGYKFITYIDPSCKCHTNIIGENCFILEQNVIQPYVRIGNNVILWSGNHIGHHSIIEDNVFIASHAVISGSVKLGNNSFIGVNSTIRDNVNIGAYNIIGASSLIIKNTNDNSVYAPRNTEISKIPSNKLIKI